MSKSSEVVLVINPGSTSTKLAIFHGHSQIAGHTIVHTIETLKQFKTLWDQFDFRLNAIQQWVREQNQVPDAVAAVGGLLKPVPGGTYTVSEKMIRDAQNNLQGEHPSNLGCALAYEFGQRYTCPAYIVDPVSVDEFEPLARYSGHPLIERRSLSHALNIHAMARRAANDLNIPLESSSFVVAHLGGGISVAPVHKGRIIDVNDASSDGPFSPNRTGGLPLQPFITLCFSGEYSESDMRRLVMGSGGLVAYLQTTSSETVEERIAAGDAYALEVYQAMAYQIAKEIGAMATVLNGNVNAIVLTGGMASSDMLTTWVSQRVHFIAPVRVYPGEHEMKALAEGVLRVLRGIEKPSEYH